MVLQVREPDAAFRWDKTVMGWRSLKLLWSQTSKRRRAQPGGPADQRHDTRSIV